MGYLAYIAYFSCQLTVADYGLLCFLICQQSGYRRLMLVQSNDQSIKFSQKPRAQLPIEQIEFDLFKNSFLNSCLFLTFKLVS